MLVAERDVLVVEPFPQLVELVLEACLRPTFGHFLQEDDVGGVVFDHLGRAIEAIAPIDTSHPFVDVPSQDPDLHLPGLWPFALAAVPVGMHASPAVMIDEVLSDLKSGLEKAIDSLKREL